MTDRPTGGHEATRQKTIEKQLVDEVTNLGNSRKANNNRGGTVGV